MNPLLIGGKKFDLRIYVLVTQYQPLTVYLYREGFGRFTHQRYSSNLDDLSNTFMHLTNVAIQKTSEKYDDKLGGKWDLRGMKLFLMSKYGADKVNEAYILINDLIIKSLLSVQRTIMNDKHCFELYGFDVLLDDNLKPWLIEINASPSMTANTPTDYETKLGLLEDVFTVLDLERVLTGQE
jgi:tubulin polyglutamylase TTLL9